MRTRKARYNKIIIIIKIKISSSFTHLIMSLKILKISTNHIFSKYGLKNNCKSKSINVFQPVSWTETPTNKRKTCYSFLLRVCLNSSSACTSIDSHSLASLRRLSSSDLASLLARSLLMFQPPLQHSKHQYNIPFVLQDLIGVFILFPESNSLQLSCPS